MYSSRVARCPSTWCPDTCSTRQQPGAALLPSTRLPLWFEFGHVLVSASGSSVRCESLGFPLNQAPRLGAPEATAAQRRRSQPLGPWLVSGAVESDGLRVRGRWTLSAGHQTSCFLGHNTSTAPRQELPPAVSSKGLSAECARLHVEKGHFPGIVGWGIIIPKQFLLFLLRSCLGFCDCHLQCPYTWWTGAWGLVWPPCRRRAFPPACPEAGHQGPSRWPLPAEGSAASLI